MWRVLLLAAVLGGAAHAAPTPAPRAPGVVVAEVVAIDTPLIYNRFGSMNPYGMVYALAGDVERVPGGRWTHEGLTCPGAWRFRAGVRPRPLVLRGNVGDTLEVRFTNRLMAQPDLSRCSAPAGTPYHHLTRPHPEAGAPAPRPDAGPLGGPADWPRTRSANVFIPGVRALPGDARTDAICRGLRAVPRGGSVTCRYALERPGTHLFSSTAAPSGGEGDGGSLTHGLFGALNVERAGSRYYHSQVTAAQLDRAWPRTPGGGRAALDYANLDLLAPLGAGRYRVTGGDLHAVIWEPPPTPAEVRVADADVLDAVRLDPAYAAQGAAAQAAARDRVRRDLHAQALALARAEYARAPAFREFTAIFHDELKTVYAEPFAALGTDEKLTGVKDGFGLNYGASGMGSILLANRLGLGPAATCVECLYEEFFLQSWANGDPALLEAYRHDPSNVFHSYLNDRVAFRNLHAGPKETHVFHLHAHQWLSASDEDRGSYLDSQTIGPMQGFSYSIYGGGLNRPMPAGADAHGGHGTGGHADGAGDGHGDHEAPHGSGNRNRTVGDSIFHCHLYPHFAQGMWALWRTHDVLEDGTRTLPDGQPRPGLSLRRMSGPPRPGTDPATGRAGAGTPVPGVVPLPAQALPPLPTYGDTGMPGYPYFIPGTPGHRAPQPPLDLADDAGLPRHTVQGGERHVAAAPAGTDHAAHDPQHTLGRALALADFTAHLTHLKLRLLPAAGTPLERRAMQFHAGQFGRQPLPGGGYGTLRGAATGRPTPPPRDPAPVDVTRGYAGYPSTTPDGTPAVFTVNGAPPQPGAPFADPCGAPRDARHRDLGAYVGDPALRGFRRYDVSAIQLDLVVNKEGWHDPQGRINVLSGTPNAPLSDKAAYFSNAVRREGRASTAEEPFFFRAQSGECITYHHSNRIPKDLERDDFQMRTPTDIIGQHIHLVKFDVTSSDGSGNGWNYEDGTLAPDAVLERKCADTAWRRAHGQPARFTDPSTRWCGRTFPEFGTPEFAALPVQTSVQRWFADPIVTVGRTPGPPTASMPGMTHAVPDRVRRDRTLRTVFTHDHFAPSSIQQHGFYSALLIEPFVRENDVRLADAWLRPDGTPLADAQGQAVGYSAILRHAADAAAHRDQREFALAVADFALLYDPRTYRPAPPDPAALRDPARAEAALDGRSGMNRLLAEARLSRTRVWGALHARGVLSGPDPHLTDADVRALQAWADGYWARHGRPVDPPRAPEAISTAHHNPFLINYRNEPLPLRLGVNTHADSQPCGTGYVDHTRVHQSTLRTGRVRVRPQGSVDAARTDGTDPAHGLTRGDPAGVFLSALHGDPCTPILRAYEGELASFRLVQGAQEVQHVFTVEGLSWKRVPDVQASGDLPDHEVAQGHGTSPFGVRWTRDNPLAYTNAQEIGISEHFEAEIDALPNVRGGERTTRDRLYHFGTQDALWNGAWGLVRVHDDPVPGLEPVAAGGGPVNVTNVFEVFPAAPTNPAPPATVPYVDASGRRLPDVDAVTAGTCPVVPGTATRVLRFAAVATRVDLLRPGRGGLAYDATSGVTDPDALVLLPLSPAELRAATTEGTLGPVVDYGRVMALLRARDQRAVQPFVLRAAAGDCVELSVFNALTAPGEPGLPDRRGDAPMPTIVPLNVGTHPADAAQARDLDCGPGPRTGACARDLRPSAHLALTVPVVAMAQGLPGNALPVGRNPLVRSAPAGGSPFGTVAAPPTAQGHLSAHRMLFYAGEVTLQPVPGSARDVTVRVRPHAFGPLPLRAYSDVIGHGSHGLLGAVVIEPRGARVLRPSADRPDTLLPVPAERWHTLGPAAFICTAGSQVVCQQDSGPAHGFAEHVLVVRDGLNLWWRGRPVGHCTVCDDSYDLGDRGVNYTSAPLWARLRHGPSPQDTRPGTDLNRAVFPDDVLTPAFAPVPTPTVTALAGQDVRLRVLQVDGRARQHAFVVGTFGYEDQLPGLNSPNSALVAPGRAFTAHLQGTGPDAAGCALYRDGPGMFMGAGVWGLIDVRSRAAPGVSRC